MSMIVWDFYPESINSADALKWILSLKLDFDISPTMGKVLWKFSKLLFHFEASEKTGHFNNR